MLSCCPGDIYVCLSHIQTALCIHSIMNISAQLNLIIKFFIDMINELQSM